MVSAAIFNLSMFFLALFPIHEVTALTFLLLLLTQCNKQECLMHWPTQIGKNARKKPGKKTYKPSNFWVPERRKTYLTLLLCNWDNELE